ncbi:MAG: ATP-binding protein [Bacteroidales bacterium]
MKEIVIISGKGGTGKTSITASFAMLEGNNSVVADCDVDAADMHLLLKPDFTNAEDFYSGEIAVLEQDKCTKCGKCKKICRFDAINLVNKEYIIDELDCEGCGYCARICPTQAIKMHPALSGKSYISKTKTNTALVHAELAIGADNSGKLVTKVKQTAKEIAEKENFNYLIVDGTPGIGCPVTASLTGADYAIIVTEPTVSGIHDMKRAFELVQTFKIGVGIIINKYDLNPEKSHEIESFIKEERLDYLGKFNYNEKFTKSMTQGKTIVEFDDTLNKEMGRLWKNVKKLVNT